MNWTLLSKTRPSPGSTWKVVREYLIPLLRFSDTSALPWSPEYDW